MPARKKDTPARNICTIAMAAWHRAKGKTARGVGTKSAKRCLFQETRPPRRRVDHNLLEKPDFGDGAT
jgi:hypothetical protein